MLGLGLGLNKLRSSGLSSILLGAMVWGRKSLYKWGETSLDVWGFANPNDIDPESQAIYDRIISDGGVSNLTRLNYFVVGLKTIYGSLSNVPVCYDAHWIGYKLGSGTGATAGQAAAKLYSLTVAGDAVQTTAASQPLLLAHNGASSDNYWWGSGVASNYVTTPSSAVSNITGDIEMVAKISIYDETGEKVIIAKRAGASASYAFSSTSKLLRFRINTTTYDSNASHSFAVNEEYFAKVTRQQSSGDIKFFTSLDGITYTQLGTTISGITVPIDTFSIPLTVGLLGDLSSFPMKGKIFRATISNSIGGTPVVDFNPATYNASTSQTQWTSSTGEVWTINTGTATTGYKGTIVDRVIVQSDGVDDYLDNTTFVRNDTMTQYLAFSSQAGSVSGVPQIIDSSSTNYRNSIFQNVSLLMSSWMNGASTMASASNLLNRRYILSANYNAGISNNLNLNNIAGNVSTYSPTPSATGIRLFSKGGTVSSHNATINTYVYCANNDTANNTIMFNFLKTLNNL